MRDAAAFIRQNLPPTEVPGTGGVRLHLAGPRSGLARLVPPGGTPYWAHAWPGGLALAAHLLSRPEAVRGRPVLELGQGSGLAAIAAMRAGAASAVAYDADPLAPVATRLNAEANGVLVVALDGRPEDGVTGLLALAGEGAILLAGDVFYDAAVASRSATVLDAAAARGATVLVGDLGRAHLPRDRLEPLAAYPVRDVGDGPGTEREGWAFRWRLAETKGAPHGAPLDPSGGA